MGTNGVSQIFNEPLALKQLLDKLLQRLVAYGNFMLAEIWLIGADKNRITLAAHISGIPGIQEFYEESERLKSFAKCVPRACGIGLAIFFKEVSG